MNRPSRHGLPTWARSGIAACAATAIAFAGAAPAEAQGRIRSADGNDVVPGSYIVVFKDDVSAATVPSRARSLAAGQGGTVTSTFSAALRGFAVRAGKAQARRLAADPRVAYVQPNLIYRADATQTKPPSYGLDRIDQRALPLNHSYGYSTTAGNVTAYVVDTGLRTSHTDFGGRASIGYDAVGDGKKGQDCNGHGTHVAGTIGGKKYGVAKGVKLVGVRVLDCEGSGSSEQIIAGLDWVTAHAHKPAVANMSLGTTLIDTALDGAVERSIDAGVTYSVAAGNGLLGLVGEDACLTSPARVPAAITVSATDKTDTKPDWANTGGCVDIFAPGVDITSDWNTGNSAKNTISGTSMSTPHVTGATALYLARHPSAKPQQVRDALVRNASGAVKSPGLLSPDDLLYTRGL
jgi:subtilisin family serine protease